MGRRSRSANRPANRPDDAVPDAIRNATPEPTRQSAAGEQLDEDLGAHTVERRASGGVEEAEAGAEAEEQPSRLRRRAQLLREIDRAKAVRARLSPVGDASTRLRRPLRHV